MEQHHILIKINKQLLDWKNNWVIANDKNSNYQIYFNKKKFYYKNLQKTTKILIKKWERVKI